MRNISPSLLSADFTILKDEIETLVNAGASRLHLDVMDGHFVPNLTFGPFIIKQIRHLTKAHFETHLMITEPRKYLKEYIDAGSDTLIFHFEASDDISRDLKFIRENGAKAGLAINPNISPNQILQYLNELDYILIMSVFPGFSGQSFIKSTLNTMKTLSEACRDRDILIGVDGGVNLKTIRTVYDTGIDITIVGSGLLKAGNISERFQALLNA